MPPSGGITQTQLNNALAPLIADIAKLKQDMLAVDARLDAAELRLAALETATPPDATGVAALDARLDTIESLVSGGIVATAAGGIELAGRVRTG